MDKLLMAIAIEEAYKGIRAGHGGPFGAVVTRGGKVIAKAHNTVLKDKDPVQHAEMRAISMAAGIFRSYDLSGCEIYSTTEPCPMCFSAIHWARIDGVIYGTAIEDVAELGFNELAIHAETMKKTGKSRVRVRGGFMREECVQLLSFWQSLPDRKVY
ncbi:MAG: nucleoside deaminase [Candidatus Omnitrophota bacterium]